MTFLLLAFAVSILTALASFIDKWKRKDQDGYAKTNSVALILLTLGILSATAIYISSKDSLASKIKGDKENTLLRDSLLHSQNKMQDLQIELYNKTTGGIFKPQVFPIVEENNKISFNLYNPSKFTISDIEISFMKYGGQYLPQTDLASLREKTVEKTLFYPIIFTDRAYDKIYTKAVSGNEGSFIVVVRWRYSFYSITVDWKKKGGIKIHPKFYDNNTKEFHFENLIGMYD